MNQAPNFIAAPSHVSTPSSVASHDVQYFPLSPSVVSGWRDVFGAKLWVHLPAAEEDLEDRHAWVNLYYVSTDKRGHTFLTQEAATKVGGFFFLVSVKEMHKC